VGLFVNILFPGFGSDYTHVSIPGTVSGAPYLRTLLTGSLLNPLV